MKRNTPLIIITLLFSTITGASIGAICITAVISDFPGNVDVEVNNQGVRLHIQGKDVAKLLVGCGVN